MRGFTQWILTTFTSPVGLLLLAMLDSTLFFWIPFGVDAATIVFAMRGVAPWWAVAALATAGSLAGATLTFWMGRKVGDAGLERFISAGRLARVRRRIGKQASTTALAALSLIPPPFPFTPVLLAAGALEVRPALFFLMLAFSRYLRFGVEAYLARRFGPATLGWLESPIVQNVVLAFVALTAALTTFTIVRLARSSKQRTASRSAA